MMKRILLLLLTLCMAAPALAEEATVYIGAEPEADYQRQPAIHMPSGADYQPLDWGVTTWRGDSFRGNAAVGTLETAPVALEEVWTVETGTLGIPDEQFQGFSAFSQPLILKWSADVRSLMNMTNIKTLKEVVFPSLDGHIYFLNLVDGTSTRDAIDVGYPLLGAATVHPQGYPVMLIGQYSDQLRYGRGSLGLHWYELLTQRRIHYVDSMLQLAGTNGASTGAFNTSALIDRNTNTAVALSKDGYLYTQRLDLRMIGDEQLNILRMQQEFCLPVWARVTQEHEQVTTAPVMYSHRLWFGTSEGRVVCVDTTTMQPLWAVKAEGPIYALAMEQDGAGQLWLYTGGASGTEAGACRLNADTGETLWKESYQPLTSMSGMIAGPVVGEQALADRVIVTLNEVTYEGTAYHGLMLALDKATGRVLWKQSLPQGAVSSPVAVYDEVGNGWLVQATQLGMLYLISGETGEIVSSIKLEGQRPSSPAVYGDMLVIGSTVPSGGRIHGVCIVVEE